MSMTKISAALDVKQMREAFDRLFALPDLIKSTESDDFLAIHVGTRPFVLRVAELARIETGLRLVGVPGGDSWLVGLTNCQGKLVPVHSLELALGFDRTAGKKRWLAICGREEPLGLEFDELDGYLRIPQADIFRTGGAESVSKHDQHAVRIEGELRPVVHLPSIIEAVRRRVSSPTI